MDNKYQEALDWCVHEKLIDDDVLSVFQELINNMKFVEEVQTPDYIRVQNENEILEKALDIVCENPFNIKKEYWLWKAKKELGMGE